MYNAAERKDVKKAEKESKLADVQRREVIRGIMSVAGGRAWMLERLEQCHVFHTSFNGNALQTAFAEGERNVGLYLLNDIMSSTPEHYILMMQERNERDRSSAAASASRSDGDIDRSGDDEIRVDSTGYEQGDPFQHQRS